MKFKPINNKILLKTDLKENTPKKIERSQTFG